MNEVVKEKLYLVILLNTTNEDVQKLHWNFFTLFYTMLIISSMSMNT